MVKLGMSGRISCHKAGHFLFANLMGCPIEGIILAREAPLFVLYFASYNIVKEQVEDLLKGADMGTAEGGGGGRACPYPSHAQAYAALALAGGISGALAWLVTYPFDVIKTQIQTNPMDSQYARRGTRCSWV